MANFEGMKILIIDDDQHLLSIYEEILKEKLPQCKHYTFSDTDEEFLKVVNEENIDLFIVDIVLNGQNGRRLSSKLCTQQKRTAFLFISAYNYDFEAIKELKNFKLDCVYDFIKKPTTSELFLNRVQVLLKVVENQKTMYVKYKDEKEHLTHSIWDLLNYANLFVLAINPNYDVSLANWFLSTTLGFKTEEEMVGQNWLNFVDEKDKQIFKHIQGKVFKNGHINTREYVNDIITLENKLLPVRWFNAIIDTDQTPVGLFSIGVPITRTITHTDNVDSIRAYWKDIIERDKTVILAMREILGQTQVQK